MNASETATMNLPLLLRDSMFAIVASDLGIH